MGDRGHPGYGRWCDDSWELIMLNMEFSQRVVINTQEMDWVSSPSPSVYRKPLAREDREAGHATSIVRYEKGASFASHVHGRGEEIFVLEGIFSDEHGDYGPGSYIRNPPGSTHSPFSKEGCVIFVKLEQFMAGDAAQVYIDTNSERWLPGLGGLQVMPLHEFSTAEGAEHVALVKWPADEIFKPHRHFGGEEILVLSGVFQDEQGEYPRHTWLRNPHMSVHHPFVKEETVILVKTGHLPKELAEG